MTKPKWRKNWPMRRVNQIEDLRRLINEVGSLNSGNGIIQRIERCLKLARRLDSNFGRRELRFVDWLDKQAWTEIEPVDG